MVKIQIDVRSEGDFSRRDNLYVAGGAERSDTPGYTQMMPLRATFHHRRGAGKTQNMLTRGGVTWLNINFVS